MTFMLGGRTLQRPALRHSLKHCAPALALQSSTEGQMAWQYSRPSFQIRAIC